MPRNPLPVKFLLMSSYFVSGFLSINTELEAVVVAEGSPDSHWLRHLRQLQAGLFDLLRQLTATVTSGLLITLQYGIASSSN